jgi:UrcA family protein
MGTLRETGTLLTAVALFAVSSTTLAARAIDAPRGDGRPTKTVSVADLDFANPGDVQTLYLRVENAAKDVCRVATRGEKPSTRNALNGWRDRCVRVAVEDAVRSAGDPRLTAVHRGIAERVASL